MTAIEKLFRLRIADPGATVVAGNVDWETTTNLVEVGPVGGQRVEPKDASTSAKPWSVRVLDVSDFVVSKLSDADGRADQLRRLGDLSVSTDGGSNFTVLATGRVDDVTMAGDLKSFAYTFTDERLIERTTTIFRGASSTRLAPAGFNAAWRSFQPPSPFTFVLIDVDGVNNRSTYHAIGFTRPRPNDTGLVVTDDALDLMESDFVDGAFETLRANIAGTDRTVRSFNGSPPFQPLRNLIDGATEEPTIFEFVVSGYQDPGTEGSTLRNVYFHMPDHAPTDKMPLHLGGQPGIDPFQFAKDVYDGDWQDSANPATVRYSSDHFSAYHPSTNPVGLIGRFPRIHPRITGPETMADVLAREVYAKNRVVPILNADGEVAPVFIGQPDITALPDPDNLFEFTKANTRKPHPTWENRGRDQVTVTRVEFEYARLARTRNDLDNAALDGMVVATRDQEREADNASDVRAVHSFKVTSLHEFTAQKSYADRIAREIHDRHADGPVYTTVHGTSATEGVVTGDWVVIDLDTYPSLQNQSRSGKRIAQVLSKSMDVDGPVFEMMEAGSNAQPLATPSVSAAANSDLPKNAIDVTISSLPSGAGYELHVAENGTEPAEGSDAWQYRVVRGDGAETTTLRDLPSGSTIWVRVRSTQNGRISSDWSTADSQATTALTAPSSVADSNVTADAATVTWTVGESDYDLLVDLDGTFEALLPAGSDSYRFEGLTASTGYTAGVRHVDPWGGESTRATDGFTTGATPESLLVPNAVAILVGGAP